MASRFVISLLFAIIVALFAIQNSGVVTINFLFTEYPVSQALVILISAALGAIIVMFLGAVKQFKLQRKNKDQTKLLAEKEKAVEDKDKIIEEKGKIIESLQNELQSLKEEKTVNIEKSESSMEEQKLD